MRSQFKPISDYIFNELRESCEGPDVPVEQKQTTLFPVSKTTAHTQQQMKQEQSRVWIFSRMTDVVYLLENKSCLPP